MAGGIKMRVLLKSIVEQLQPSDVKELKYILKDSFTDYQLGDLQTGKDVAAIFEKVNFLQKNRDRQTLKEFLQTIERNDLALKLEKCVSKTSTTRRKRNNEANMERSSGHYNSGSGRSSHLTSNSSSSGQNIDRIVRAQEVVAEHIQAKTLNIDGMYLGRMVTRQGDVAYHFLLKDDSEVFQEGEIVGFVKDPKNDNEQVICKLDYKLASESILKGVVTRSQYLEARIPEKGVRSETICMLGMVPVQVIGTVHMNEPLYASPDRPGLAIGGHQLDVARLKEASFIGYSFSARKTDDDSSVGVVEAAVGILQSASQCLVSEKFRDITEDFDGKLSEIKKESKNRNRCFTITAISTALLFMLLGISLWQLYMPGSKLRYYNCERGRKIPHGSANFWFIPERLKYVKADVNGIQFTYNDLIKKMEYADLNRNLKGTGYLYYLNIDRCAYGQLRETKDIVLGQKEVYGPTIFAVDEKCWHAYFYDEVNEEWKRYRSVSWPNYRNLYCDPEPPNRRAERFESKDEL